MLGFQGHENCLTKHFFSQSQVKGNDGKPQKKTLTLKMYYFHEHLYHCPKHFPKKLNYKHSLNLGNYTFPLVKMSNPELKREFPVGPLTFVLCW
jgi:hypothetical protein